MGFRNLGAGVCAGGVLACFACGDASTPEPASTTKPERGPAQALFEQSLHVTSGPVCGSVVMNADSPVSPSAAGTDVTLSATATCSGGTPYYQFWLKTGGTWTTLCAWSTSSTCTWTAPAPGTYEIQVGARSSLSSASLDSFVEV